MERCEIWKIKSIWAQKGRTSVTVGIATRIETEDWVTALQRELQREKKRIGAQQLQILRMILRRCWQEAREIRSSTINTTEDQHHGRWTCPPYDSGSAGSWQKRTYQMDLPSLWRSIRFSARRALCLSRISKHNGLAYQRFHESLLGRCACIESPARTMEEH